MKSNMPPYPHSNKPTGKSGTLTPWCPETGVLTSHCYQPPPPIPINPQVRVTHSLHDAQRQVSSQVIVTNPPPPHSNKPTGKSGTLTPRCPETDRCPHKSLLVVTMKSNMPPYPHSNKPTGKSDTLTPWCPETGVLTSHCYQPPLPPPFQ